MSSIFHSSIESAQHGPKGLDNFLAFAKESGAAGAQPSNYMIESDGGKFKSAQEIKDAFEKHDLIIDGISAHCPFWVHTSIWNGKCESVHRYSANQKLGSPESLKKALENDYFPRLFDLSLELGLKLVPMQWGDCFGERAGLSKSSMLAHVNEGLDRFADQTEPIRNAAEDRGITLAHKLGLRTAAAEPDDFTLLIESCAGAQCLGIHAEVVGGPDGRGMEDYYSNALSLIVGLRFPETGDLRQLMAAFACGNIPAPESKITCIEPIAVRWLQSKRFLMEKHVVTRIQVRTGVKSIPVTMPIPMVDQRSLRDLIEITGLG